jgi:hypothetical protein
MKVKVLMATLVMTLMLGVQGFAVSPCDSNCVDPCAACNGFSKSGGLFSGLKKLVNGARFNNCDPCDPAVLCNPCDEAAFCNPCDEVTCDMPRFNLGGRLRNMFASQACTPCDLVGDCTPCEVVANCDPCGDVNGCSTPKFSLRSLNPFKGIRLNRGCDSDCGPCDNLCDRFNNCGPCDNLLDCNPCDDICGDTYCGPRGRLFDLPRVNLSKLFGKLRVARCDDGGLCSPCDNIRDCMPCDACR